MAGSSKASPSLRAYRSLQAAKKKHCLGKATKAELNQKASAYKKAAAKAGKPAGDIAKTVKRFVSGKCAVGVGAKKPTATRRKTTPRKTK